MNLLKADIFSEQGASQLGHCGTFVYTLSEGFHDVANTCSKLEANINITY